MQALFRLLKLRRNSNSIAAHSKRNRSTLAFKLCSSRNLPQSAPEFPSPQTFHDCAHCEHSGRLCCCHWKQLSWCWHHTAQLFTKNVWQFFSSGRSHSPNGRVNQSFPVGSRVKILLTCQTLIVFPSCYFNRLAASSHHTGFFLPF